MKVILHPDFVFSKTDGQFISESQLDFVRELISLLQTPAEVVGVKDIELVLYDWIDKFQSVDTCQSIATAIHTLITKDKK